MIEIYDRKVFEAVLGDETETDPWGGFVGPEDERPPPSPQAQTAEEEMRKRCIRTILNDPRGNLRPPLVGTEEMAAQVVAATATMGHFAAVTGIIERAVVQSARCAQTSARWKTVSFPPILIVAPPGVGKTHFCRVVSHALSTARVQTTCVPISVNLTSDRGQLGGLSTAWRGAKMGKLARGLLIQSASASPLFLLDEIDKAPALIAGENTLDVLLAALEPENARAFTDEYLEAPIDLRGALWIASANSLRALPDHLLSRMLVIDVARPGRDQSRTIVKAIAQEVLATAALGAIREEAVEALLRLAPRRVRLALEIACAHCAYARRDVVSAADVTMALGLVHERATQIGFLR